MNVDAPRERSTGRPTVHDVAERAQVSPMTVSRVLSGGPNVRAELRERVEQAAADIGYRRNENARSLRPGHRSGLIGVTITNIANPYYAEMQRGIEEVAAAHSRRILVGNSNEDASLEAQLVADFLGRQVEGLIVVPSGSGGSKHLTAAALGGVPLAFASRAVDGIDVDTVLIDDVGGAFDATSRLLDEGHERIAFLGNRVSVFTGRRRLRGFRDALAARGVPVVEELVRVGQQDVGSAELAMAELLALPEPPTAVFSANNRNTIGAIRAIEADKKRQVDRESAVPIRLFGFDSFEFADLSPVPLSVIAHDARELGRRAAEMLFDRVDGDQSDGPARLVELPVYLQATPSPN